MKLPPAVRAAARAAERAPRRSWSELAARRLADAGPQPWVTYLDETTGERTELSHATFDNWVAKSANLLVEEAEVDHGDDVVVALDGHWTLAVVLHACARAGAVAKLGPPGEATPAKLAVAHEAVLADVDRDSPVFVVGDGMGGRPLGEPELPAFTEDVLAYADDYDDPDVTPALDLLAAREDGRELIFGQGAALACGDALLQLGVRPADRMLLAGPADRLDLVLVGLGAYVAGAAIVVGRRLAAEAVWRHAEEERAEWLVCAPEQLSELVAVAAVGDDLQGVLCTGPLTVETWQAAVQALGVAVCPSLGSPAVGVLSTVVPAGTVHATLGWLAQLDGRLAGTAARSARLAILGQDGRPVERLGEPGELAVGGPLLPSGIEPPPALIEDALRTGAHGSLQTGPDGQEWLLLD